MVLRRVKAGWRVYSRRLHRGRRLNLGTFKTKAQAQRRERQLARFR